MFLCHNNPTNGNCNGYLLCYIKDTPMGRDWSSDMTTFIARDQLCSNADHAKFLRSLIANAERKLAQPNVRYGNGRMSHDVERETLNGATSDLCDLMLEGYYYADGRFAGFEASAA